MQQSAEAYPELQAIGLYAPSGDSLGEFIGENVSLPELRDFDSSLDSQTEVIGDQIVVWKRVPAKIENCCECKTKALTTKMESANYSYYLRAVISRKPLFSAISDLRSTIIAFCIGIILLGFILGRQLASWLLSGLQAFVAKIQQYLNGQIKASEVQLAQQDEVGFLSKTFSEKLIKLEKTTADLIEAEKQKAKVALMEQHAALTAQVSHDIRSPLTALNIVTEYLDEVPEEKRLLLRNATQRINDIANMLLNASKTQSSTLGARRNQGQVEMLSAIVDELISEKRMQYRQNIETRIEADLSSAYGLFAKISAIELKTILSNLVNNSVEALNDGCGRVLITLSQAQENEGLIEITVSDNGKGIPSEILHQLGQKGVSFGKENTTSGSGLGLYHAKEKIKQWGGEFIIESQPGEGTVVRILLPREKAPTWFVEKLLLSPNSRLISLDDDLSIHQVWKGRFAKMALAKNNIQHLTFTSGEQFKDWLQKASAKPADLFLMDFELLQQPQTGLDIIEELSLGQQAILVTSHYEEKEIRERCAKIGVRILPKAMAGFVPIEIVE